MAQKDFGDLDPLIVKNMTADFVYSDRLDGDCDEDYIPYGCKACGGDYPMCKQGCALFDDE